MRKHICNYLKYIRQGDIGTSFGLYLHLCICICMCVYVCLDIYIYMYTYVSNHIGMYPIHYVHVYIYMNIHIYIYICMCICIYMYVYVYIFSTAHLSASCQGPRTARPAGREEPGDQSCGNPGLPDLLTQTLRVQSTQIRSTYSFSMRDHNYGLGYMLQIWVLGPLGRSSRVVRILL